jgi:sugar phosphate permease
MSSDEDYGKALKYRWLIFWVLASCYILVYFHRLCPAIVAVDMMKDLGADGTLLGFLGSAYFYPYAAMQLPAGLLSDSLGPRKTVAIFFLIAFAGSLILGTAPSITAAITGRTLTGIGVAMLFVPTMKIFAEWFRIKEFALMTGVLVAMGGIGTLISTSPLAYLSKVAGWRFSFILVGIITLFLSLLVWLIVRDRPGDMGWPDTSGSLHSSQEELGLLQGVRKVMSTFSFWPLALWFFCLSALFFSLGGLWGGPYLMQVYGFSKTETGNILMMIALGMIIGSPLLSFISNSVIKKRKTVIILSTLISLCTVSLFTLNLNKLTRIELMAMFFLLGMFANGIVVIGFTTAKELFPVNIAGTSTGLVNIFPFAGGAIAQPLLGYILELQGREGDAFTLAGYRNMFIALLLITATALFFSLLLKETLTDSKKFVID